MEQNVKVFKFDNNLEVWEIEPGKVYGVPSKSEKNVYRRVDVIQSESGYLRLTCDCDSAGWRGPYNNCWHIKVVAPVAAEYYRLLEEED